MTQESASTEEVLGQFNRLIRELLRGQINRNAFRPWEVKLLLDIENCRLREAGREAALRRYQRAVQRQMETGATVPMMLSEYLGRKPQD
jgi:hypothetical protein